MSEFNVDPYPLNWPFGWPRTPDHKRISQFKFKGLTFGSARDSLQQEVKRLGGSNLVVSTNIRVKSDGLPYADTRKIEDPGVAIYFLRNGKGAPVSMARDAYNTVAGNMRSLGLALRYLRGLERHGGGIMVERAFDGFTALPEPGAAKPWQTVLGLDPGIMERTAPQNREPLLRAHYLVAAKRAHPDTGGTDEQMAEINSAYEQGLKSIGSN
jgi:hypothetical protein